MARMTTESYEKYLTRGLESISDKLSVKVYKLCPYDTNPIFTRGEDLRVQVRWEKSKILLEFFVDKSFWYVSNKVKEDKLYMRSIADHKLKMFEDAIIRNENESKVIAEGSYSLEDHKLTKQEIRSLTGNKTRRRKRKKV